MGHQANGLSQLAANFWRAATVDDGNTLIADNETDVADVAAILGIDVAVHAVVYINTWRRLFNWQRIGNSQYRQE